MITSVTTFLAVLLVSGGVGEPEYCSPAFLVADASGQRIYVADETGSRVFRVDTSRQAVSARFPLPGRPTGIALNRRGDTLHVTTHGAEGRVLVVDADSGELKSVLRAGYTPMAPVLGADESVLWVCNRFDDSVSVLDLKTARELRRLPVRREPVTAALSPDGNLLAVGHLRTRDAASRARIASVVSLIDTENRRVVSHLPLPGGGVGIRGLCFSPDGQQVFVSHILARNHVPATQLANGWLVTNAVSILEVRERKLLSTLILDDVGRGAANPRGLACTADGRRLVVALAGVHEIAVINVPKTLARLRELNVLYPEGERVYSDGLGYAGVSYTSFGFLDRLKQRLSLDGRGPRHVAIAGGKIHAGMYYSGTLESIDLADPGAGSESILLDRNPSATPARRGERLFHDASICFQGWQSCSTCHPDGRADGLNWDLTNDGVGNFKNARSLLFADRTAPLTMAGLFPSLDDCVRTELRTILFTEFREEDAEGIVSYIKSLRPLASPHLESGKPGAAALRGREVFRKAGCSDCHRGEYYTIGTMKDVGTSVPGDHRKDFVIPGLREVWRSAPYLHHGGAATVREIFTKFNPEDRHGKTSDLTGGELADLVSFVLSL